LDPDGLDTHYYFQYGIDVNYGQKTATEAAGLTAVPGGEPISGIDISGLQPKHTYHFRIVAFNSAGTTFGLDRSFTTPSPPTVAGLTSSGVTASAADLTAKLNPQGFDTTYHFEYGTTAAYGESEPVPEGDIGSGSSDQEVSVHITGLETTTYHFRVVATNKWGTTTSADQTFNFYPPSCPNAHVRQQTGADSLPDCRAYEIVSASNAAGAILFGGKGSNNNSPTEDSHFSYGTGFGVIPEAGDPTDANVDRYVATRTNVGWRSHYVGLRGNEALCIAGESASTTMTQFIDYNAGDCFNGNAGASVEPYVWDAEGNFLGRWPTNRESVPGGDRGIAVVTDQIGKTGYRAGNPVATPSADYSHFVFAANSVAYAENGVIGAPGSVYDNDIAKETVTVVSRTASGDIPKGAGSNWTEEGEGAEYITIPGVSTDGSHILMATDGGPCTGVFIYNSQAGHFEGICQPSEPKHLYMRVNDAVTYEIAGGTAVDFVDMTPDGSKVFFVTSKQITADDTDNSVDLYEWSLDGSGVASIIRLSTANNGGGNSDGCTPASGWTSACNVTVVRGGAASDNSIAPTSGDVYFYSPEQLDGSKGIPNQVNVYVYRGGEVHYVLTLGPGNTCEEEFGCGNGPLGRINVSPEGDHIAFTTNQRLTGYDNKGFREMYTYEPSSGELTCVSCSPSADPPVGGIESSHSGPFMTDDGRAFFYTPDALVPKDTDKARDVYEYTEGRPQLISTGTVPADRVVTPNQERTVGLESVGADGVNVYFSTYDRMVGQDQNGQYQKIYDARSGGGFPFNPINASCEAADECHGPGSLPPAHPTLGSTSDLGDRGNYAASQGKKRKRHRKHHAHRLPTHHRHQHTRRAAGQSHGGAK
jgi:hypothetical protein